MYLEIYNNENMKKLLFVIFASILTLNTNAQNFDIIDFNQKAQIAEWLFEYDMIAWWTSDSVMTEDESEIEQLGSEWFCYKDEDNVWHAFYGKDEDGKFNLVFHYEVDTSYTVKRTFSEVDTAKLNSYSRAIVNSVKQIESLKDSVNIRFNQYLRYNNNNEIEVWILPAFQSNGTAVFGGEFHYVFDSTGNIMLSKEEYYQGGFRGFKVGEPREIWLDYTDVEKPTLGAVFFVWYYKKYFTKISIETSKAISTVYKSDNTYTWIHIEKDLGKKKKRKIKKNRSANRQ